MGADVCVAGKCVVGNLLVRGELLLDALLLPSPRSFLYDEDLRSESSTNAARATTSVYAPGPDFLLFGHSCLFLPLPFPVQHVNQKSKETYTTSTISSIKGQDIVG